MHRLRRPMTALPFVAVLLIASACEPDEAATPAEESEISPLADLHEGWNTVTPGGATVCSDGSEFSFFVRPGSTERIHFYLEGGGACWSGATCDVQGDPTYSPVVNETDGQAANGVFAFDREDNPLRDHTTIFVPYCSGDVHLGDRVVEYTAPAREDAAERTFTIQHRGLPNGRAALDWMFERFDDAEAVFVSGSSAGSIPSPVYASWIAEEWPGARVTQLGDGAGGYRGASESPPYESWGTLEVLGWESLQDLGDSFSFEDLYVAAAERRPGVQYAQYDTAEDSVQLDFLRLANQGTESLLPLLDANYEEIVAADPDFRRFVAGGEVHTILRRPEVYSFRVGDTTFLQWLTDLVEGRSPASVRCEDCTQAELVEGAEAATAETGEESESSEASQ